MRVIDAYASYVELKLHIISGWGTVHVIIFVVSMKFHPSNEQSFLLWLLSLFFEYFTHFGQKKLKPAPDKMYENLPLAQNIMLDIVFIQLQAHAR